MTPHRQNELFLQWMEAHGAILWKVARSFGMPDRCQELHQDLMVAVWQALPWFRGDSKPSTFMYRVAHNRALNWSRDGCRDSHRLVSLDDVPPPAQPAAGVGAELLERLYSAISLLPEIDRSVALLYLDDLSYRDMAAVLGISETNVGVRLNRMKKRLVELLKEIDS